MLKTKDLRDLSAEELKDKEEEFNRELFNLKVQKTTGQLGNTAIIGERKKDLARIKTVLRESALLSGKNG